MSLSAVSILSASLVGSAGMKLFAFTKASATLVSRRSSQPADENQHRQHQRFRAGLPKVAVSAALTGKVSVVSYNKLFRKDLYAEDLYWGRG